MLNVMNASKIKLSIFVPLVLGALALFLWLGRREHHHYDEFAYLYGAAHNTISALAHGEFEASNIPGFFNVKIGHLMLLRLLAKLFGNGMAAVQSIQAFYTVLVVATSAMLVWFILLLWGDFRRALALGLLSLFAPVNVYLAPKLLAEVPGVFGVMTSLLFLALALRTEYRMRSSVFLLVSALALTYGILARQNMLLLAVGGWVALWVACPPGLRRGEIFRVVAVVGMLTLGALFVSQVLLDLNPLRGLQVVLTVMDQSLPRREMFRRVLLAFGPLLLVSPLALASRRRQELIFHSIWFAIGVLPILLSFHYLEVRTVVTGAPAVVGLALLGVEVAWRWIGSPRHAFVRLVGIGIVAMVLARSNRYIQPQTQYEVDASEYATVMHWISEAYPSRPILIPWGMSDYHFLRMAYNEAPVYLANTSVFFTPLSYATDMASWVAAQKKWYGDRYINDLMALERLGSPPWLFLSWQLPGWDTGRFSWIQDNSRLRLTLVFQHGKYRVYQVDN